MYLFDTSVVSRADHEKVKRFLEVNGAYTSRFFLCVVTVSELTFGLHLLSYRHAPHEDRARTEEKIKRMCLMGALLDVSAHVAREHARIRAKFAAFKMPKAIQTRLKGKHVEMWHEDVRPSQFQLEENDLWIAAVALTYDMTLVSGDKGHEDLQQAVPELRLVLL